MSYAPPDMTAGGAWIPRELSRGEMEEFLRAQRIARLGCHAGGETYVVPLIYAYDDGALVAVTTEGRKVAMLRENPRVCVEVDEYDADGKRELAQRHRAGDVEELAGDAVEPALALLRERFARTRARGRASAARVRASSSSASGSASSRAARSSAELPVSGE